MLRSGLCLFPAGAGWRGAVGAVAAWLLRLPHNARCGWGGLFFPHENMLCGQKTCGGMYYAL